jgi:hypothetical protein
MKGIVPLMGGLWTDRAAESTHRNRPVRPERGREDSTIEGV